MKKTIIFSFILALIIPVLGYAQPIKVPTKKTKATKTEAPKTTKVAVPKIEKSMKKGLKAKTLVCKNGTQKVMNTKISGNKIILRGESIPCCVSDDKGCICSSDDCSDCKGITRDVVDNMVKKE
jgi:hypothetical protein